MPLPSASQAGEAACRWGGSGRRSRQWNTRSRASDRTRSRAAAQPDSRPLRHVVDDARSARVDVDGVGPSPREAEHHRLVGRVALAGEAERAEQLDRTRATPADRAVCQQGSANAPAARIGPTVCELDGPMPILKMSKTLIMGPPSNEQIEAQQRKRAAIRGQGASYDEFELAGGGKVRDPCA